MAAKTAQDNTAAHTQLSAHCKQDSCEMRVPCGRMRNTTCSLFLFVKLRRVLCRRGWLCSLGFALWYPSTSYRLLNKQPTLAGEWLSLKRSN
jgi:hypothetical protein